MATSVTCPACDWLIEIGEAELPNADRPMRHQQLAFYWLTRWFQEMGNTLHRSHQLADEAMAGYAQERRPWQVG